MTKDNTPLEPITVTVSSKGAINLDQLPPELAAQLSTPEVIAQIRELYRQAHPKSGRRETRAILDKLRIVLCEPGNQRIITGKPASMTAREWRTLRKRVNRNLTKQTLKEQRLARRLMRG